MPTPSLCRRSRACRSPRSSRRCPGRRRSRSGTSSSPPRRRPARDRSRSPVEASATGSPLDCRAPVAALPLRARRSISCTIASVAPAADSSTQRIPATESRARRGELALRRRDGLEDARRLAGGRARARGLDLERGLEVVHHLLDRLVALGGVLRGRPLDHQRDRRRDLRAAPLHVGQLLVDVLHRDPDLAVGVERDVAGQHLVEDDPERVDVGARVGALPHRLLGRDVVGRAEHAPGGGDARLLELAGDPEVGDLGPPVGVDQDVLRLDVAVDHAARVGDGEAAGDLDRVGDRVLHLERARARAIRCFSVSPSTYSKTM